MSGIPRIESYALPNSIAANIANWRVDADRAVLLLHDMQRYFLRPFDESMDPASSLLKNSTKLRSACVRSGIPVAYTAQPGDMTRQERGLLNDFWGPGMTAEPEDRAVIDPLAPSADDWLLTKWRYSAFARTNLLERLRAAGRDQIVICGVYAHVGILTTAIEAFSNDIKPFIVSDAIADFTYENHAMALDYAAQRCAMVVTTEKVLEDLRS